MVILIKKSYIIVANSLYATSYKLSKAKKVLLDNFNIVTEWFYEIYMVLNAGKCHYMYIGKNTKNETQNNVIFLLDIDLL